MTSRLQHYLRTAATGYGIAAIFLGGALATDLAGLQGRVLAAESGWKTGVMIYLCTGLVFALLQAVLNHFSGSDSDQPKPPRGGKRRELVPIRVTVPVRKKRR